MASVWSATNVFTEREFAIKFMLPQIARTPEAARRFLLEAKVSARINHPNIIEVIDVGQAEDGSLFLVMELLTGASLDVAIRRAEPPMSAHELLVTMRDVAAALAAAHRSGVVHRDLKPTNIYLHTDRDGRVVPKILDFGVSKILEEEKNGALTVLGTVLGSPLYMSPEQANGAEGIDGRTDVFAFGAILFEALAGQRAFDAPNFNALIVTIATKQPKSIDQVAPQLPEGLRALVRDCMVTDKEMRLASFDLVLERLATLLPELEKSGVRLPADRASDADATHAVAAQSVQPSPAPRTHSDPPPPSKNASSTPSQPPGTPNAATVPLAMHITNPPAPPVKPAPAVVPLMQTMIYERGWSGRAVGGAVLVVAVVVVIAAAFTRSNQSSAQGASSAATAGASAAAGPSAGGSAGAATPPEASSVPLVAVDSLPVASRGVAAKGMGRLSISASPGWCSVSVDGVARGVTPLAPFEVPTGSHRVDCVPPSGKARAANVTIGEGMLSRHKFALDE
jgi:serine/threonine-protein kinase